MGRETKVGLVAGLAFIICFAIILANTGRDTAPGDVSLPIAGDRLADGARTNGGAVPAHAARGRQSATHNTSFPATTPFRIRNPSPVGVESPPATGSSLALTDDITHARNSAPQVADTRLTSPIMDEIAERQRVLEEKLNSLEAAAAEESQDRSPTLTDTANATAEPQSVQAQEEKRSAVQMVAQTSGSAGRLRRHTVVPGDTLSSIAASVYGSRSHRFVNAIFDANRGVLSSPDVISLGVELTLPIVDGAGQSIPVTRSVDPPASSDLRGGALTRRAGDSDFRWYQIKKSDRYISIARAQLGDASRWREIYEMNREKFPDAGRIREGVRIKLPLARSQPSVGGGR